MKKLIFIAICLLVNINVSHADNSGKQSKSFIKIYSSLCLKHLNNLDELRNKLSDLPKLPPNKSSIFLSGKAGDAWPVPDKNGTFVIALPNKENTCAVYARRADTEIAKKMFIDIVSKAPKPLVSKSMEDKYSTTKANGKTHTLSYEWSLDKNSKAMLFILTTASSDKANLQIMGSASIISK
jgi:hypothetical protein